MSDACAALHHANLGHWVPGRWVDGVAFLTLPHMAARWLSIIATNKNWRHEGKGVKTRYIAAALAALALTGFVTAQQEADNVAAYERAEIMLKRGQEAATLTCEGKDACDRAWQLTQVSVQQESGMTVRLATDTTIDI